MPRPARIFLEGGIYHVYNRISRGEHVFRQDGTPLAYPLIMRAAVLVLLVLSILSVITEGSEPPSKPDPQNSNFQDRQKRHFDLALNDLSLDNPQRFSLFELPPPPKAPRTPSGKSQTKLNYSLVSAANDPLTPFNSLSQELVKRRQMMSSVQRHIRLEERRVYAGNPVALPPPGTLMSIEGLVNLYKTLRKALKKLKKLPAGAKVPLDHNLTLVVNDIDDLPTREIVVLPMTLGYVGDPVHANCDISGRCPLSNLPTGDITLLVRGRGAKLITVRANDNGGFINLRPTGTVKFSLQSHNKRRTWRVRLTDANKGIELPVNRWKNPRRDDWTSIPKSGLMLFVPAGVYEVEVQGPDGLTCDFEVEVKADETIHAILPPPTCR